MKQLPTVESILGNFMGNFDWTIPDILGLRNYPRNRNPLVMRSMMIIVIPYPVFPRFKFWAFPQAQTFHSTCTSQTLYGPIVSLSRQRDTNDAQRWCWEEEEWVILSRDHFLTQSSTRGLCSQNLVNTFIRSCYLNRWFCKFGISTILFTKSGEYF